MRVAIYGAGAMGTVLGAFVTKTAARPTLSRATPRTLRRLKREGRT